MKRSIIIAAVAAATALTSGATTWSLDSCINYAVEHNLTVKNREANREEARIGVTSAKSQFLPTVSANASQSWNIGRGLTSENTYANRNTSSSSWGANFNLPLFTGLSNERQLKLAKVNLLAVVEQYEAAKDDVTLNVIASYLQALYSREMHEVAMQQVELSRYELQRRQALLEAGKIPEIDMLEASSQLAQDELQATQTLNDSRIALLDLAQLLELDDIEGFDISPLNDMPLMILPPEEVYRNAKTYNHSLRAARLNVDYAERNIALAQSGYMPRLSFSAGVGSSYYTVSGVPHPSFSSQMRDNFNTYFGLSLSIPIFDAFSTRNSVKRARVQHITSKIQCEQVEDDLFKAIQQAYYQAVGAKQKSEASLVAENAAAKAFEAMREKYDIGRATPTEYEQAKNKALRTKTERIQAQYEHILRTRILVFYNKH